MLYFYPHLLNNEHLLTYHLLFNSTYLVQILFSMAEPYIHLSNTIHTLEKFTYLHIIQLRSIKALKPIKTLQN